MDLDLISILASETGFGFGERFATETEIGFGERFATETGFGERFPTEKKGFGFVKSEKNFNTMPSFPEEN